MRRIKTQSILAAAGVIAVLILTPLSCHHKHPSDTDAPAAATPEAQASETPAERSLSITAVGDCTFAKDDAFAYETSFDAYAAKYGNEYFLENVRDIFAEDDLTLVNFEGTLSTRGSRIPNTFCFRGSPDYVNVLTSSSVEAANIANNHTLDYGTEALEDTQNYLEQAGLLTCRGKDNVTVTQINGINVGLVGINYLNDRMRTELDDAIAKAKDMGAELIILSIHWGIEKATAPNADQIEAAHRAIDNGADLVLGTHPHVLQGVEKYNGRYIFYSMGNFCFGGNSNPSDKDSAIFRIKLTLDENGLVDDDNYEIIPCMISESQGYNDYQPTPASGDNKDRIINKLTRYSSELGITNLNFR